MHTLPTMANAAIRLSAGWPDASRDHLRVGGLTAPMSSGKMSRLRNMRSTSRFQPVSMRSAASCTSAVNSAKTRKEIQMLLLSQAVVVKISPRQITDHHALLPYAGTSSVLCAISSACGQMHYAIIEAASLVVLPLGICYIFDIRFSCTCRSYASHLAIFL